MLDVIVREKKLEIARRKQITSVAELRAKLRRSDRSLCTALRRSRPGFIFECKRRSPSAGEFSSFYDVGAIADVYAQHASAISVLADAPFFGGSLQDVQTVRSRVAVPVLLKDFIIDPYQVEEARSFGADAVLLILAILDDAEIQRCLAIAQRWALDVILECHDELELRRALRFDGDDVVIGINNRNLTTFEVDLDTSARLAGRVPRSRLVIAESGIRHRRDVARLKSHVDGFLIGTTVMRKSRRPRALDHACRQLRFGHTKICGLTRSEDAVLAHQHGAIEGGLVFAAGSRRRVTLPQATAITRGADLDWVGVFLDNDLTTILDTAEQLELQVVQLHGERSSQLAGELRRRLPGGVAIRESVRVFDSIPSLPVDSQVLLDTGHPTLDGGTGSRFDWSLVAQHPRRHELILAGGIDPGNVDAADRLGVAGLDVASGLESEPGLKCPELIERFFHRLCTRQEARCCNA